MGELLADARQHGRWAVDRVDLTDTAAVQAAVAGADLLWLDADTAARSVTRRGGGGPGAESRRGKTGW